MDGKAAIAKGNAVVGSPGWGIAHHDSHANLEDNVVFDVVGSGIAAEAGNEIGTWRNNITIKTTGDDNWHHSLQPTSERVNRFDFGFNGDGYWVQGAGQINIVDNIAISAAENGFIHYGGGDGGQKVRDAQTISVKNLSSKYQSIAKGTGDESVIDVSAVPIRQMSGFESYNSKKGINFWATLKNVDNQLEIEGSLAEVEENFALQPAHNFRSLVNNFKVWNIQKTGISFQYASQVDLKNGLIVGDRNNPTGKGIAGNDDSMIHNFKNITIDGFEYGLLLPIDNDISWNNSRIENVSFSNNIQNFGSRTNFKNSVPSPSGYPAYFEITNSTFDVSSNNKLPTAQFTTQAIGGLAIKFDAYTSFDKDSSEKNLNNKGIISYGWDFDNDGKIDKFGRQVNHYFDNSGSKNVNLTVWDNQGATTNITDTVNVEFTDYDNLLINGNFNQEFNTSNFPNKFTSGASDLGWIANNNWSWNSNIGNGRAANLVNQSPKGITQTILDDYMRRGNQTLSMEIKNIEKNHSNNEVTITVWGINGEFRNPNLLATGPQAVGLLPMAKTKLLDKTLGGSSFDWTNFNWDLDFGNGYQFVVFQVNSKGVNPAKGDILAIDKIKIS